MISKKKARLRWKRMTRTARLLLGKRWIQEYKGENYPRGYAKRFGVDRVCAWTELKMLGLNISEEQIEEAKRVSEAHARGRAAAKQRRKDALQEELYADDESDETFAYIAGYTPGGCPYGITWEENEKLSLRTRGDDDDDIPF